MKPDGQESRAAFEQYLKQHDAKTKKDKYGHYLYATASIAWNVWQAALKFAEESKQCTPSSAPN